MAEIHAADLRVVVGVPFVDLGAMSREVADELDAAWRRTLEDSTFIGGSAVEAFEADWANYCLRKHAIGVANGTDALELTLRGLGIGPGDEVIVPTNTFVATAEAVVSAGATPHFADVDPDTLLATPQTFEAAITSRTAAIVAVALFGNVPRMDEIADLARARGLALLEDAAQGHGATWDGVRVGAFGTAASFSFYPGKNLGAFGDAGAVVTDDDELAGRIRSLANHGRAEDSKYLHPVAGRNSRLDSLQAAVLSVKLPKLDGWNERRRFAMNTYRQHLDMDLIRMVDLEPWGQSVHHLNVVRVPARDVVRQQLHDAGIDTGVHYPVPCHLQEAYRSFPAEPTPHAEHAARDIVSLPMFPHISDAQVRSVCERLNAIVGIRDATLA